MSPEYVKYVYVATGLLLCNIKNLTISPTSTCVNFRDNPENAKICLQVFNDILETWKYELSNNQIEGAITWLLDSLTVYENRKV